MPLPQMMPFQQPMPPQAPIGVDPTWGRPLGQSPTWTQVPGAYDPAAYRPTIRADERIGDAERARACDELSTHYAAGRLTPDELDTRLADAVEALTLRDLHEVTRDLPRLRGPVPPRPTPASPRRGPWTLMDLLVLVALIGQVLLAGGMLLGLGMYDFWLFVAAGVGGAAAFMSGAAIVYLAQRRKSASAHRLP